MTRRICLTVAYRALSSGRDTEFLEEMLDHECVLCDSSEERTLASRSLRIVLSRLADREARWSTGYQNERSIGA